ncbi:hypothetical protein [Amycolatopsis sp. NPDC049159]|uniref:hypothetical protein n=1 Tax=Amycolatopsis sp. NPDC049159 TaxID=3157210 RepID=UPI0033EEF49E
MERLGPTLTALLDAAAADGDLGAEDLLHATALSCRPALGHEPAPPRGGGGRAVVGDPGAEEHLG